MNKIKCKVCNTEMVELDREYEFNGITVNYECPYCKCVEHYSNNNTCVLCGAVIPEDRMICPNCEGE